MADSTLTFTTAQLGWLSMGQTAYEEQLALEESGADTKPFVSAAEFMEGTKTVFFWLWPEDDEEKMAQTKLVSTFLQIQVMASS